MFQNFVLRRQLSQLIWSIFIWLTWCATLFNTSLFYWILFNILITDIIGDTSSKVSSPLYKNNLPICNLFYFKPYGNGIWLTMWLASGHFQSLWCQFCMIQTQECCQNQCWGSIRHSDPFCHWQIKLLTIPSLISLPLSICPDSLTINLLQALAHHGHLFEKIEFSWNQSVLLPTVPFVTMVLFRSLQS